MQTFFKDPIGLQKDILCHPSLIAAELVILSAVGHVDGNIWVSYQVGIDCYIVCFCVNVEKIIASFKF